MTTKKTGTARSLRTIPAIIFHPCMIFLRAAPNLILILNTVFPQKLFSCPDKSDSMMCLLFTALFQSFYAEFLSSQVLLSLEAACGFHGI